MTSPADIPNTPASVAIELRQCTRTIGAATRILESTDLIVGAGEILVLLGPSGCGKTTLLRLIAGLDRPDPAGRILYDHRDVTDLPVEKRGVGMVFQSYALFPNMSVAENIGYGLRVRHMERSEAKQRILEVAALVKIDGLLERRIQQLSGGQRQRVALARALAVRPRVLLLDEPLAALDAKLRDTLRDELGRLLRELKMTAIYVTHDQSEAMALGDRIAVMQAGRIVQLDTPRAIYHRPNCEFVGNFVGSINRFSVQSLHSYCPRLRDEMRHTADNAGQTELFVRPENLLVIGRSEELEPDFHATVMSTVFLGGRLRLTLQSGTFRYPGRRRRRPPNRHGARRSRLEDCAAIGGHDRVAGHARKYYRGFVSSMLICQISDLHIRANRAKCYGVVDSSTSLERCVRAIEDLRPAPDVVVVTGDLVDSGTVEDYELLRTLLRPIKQPIYLIPGNHDDRDALKHVFFDHPYLPSDRATHLHFSVDQWPVRLVALDTVVAGEPHGSINEETAVWLDRTLGAAPEHPTFLLMHHPPFVTGIGHMDDIGLSGAELIEHVVQRHTQVRRILCGHLHRSITTQFGGTIAMTAPSPAHQVELNLDVNAPVAIRDGATGDAPSLDTFRRTHRESPACDWRICRAVPVS